MKAEVGTPENSRNNWAFLRVWDMCTDDPENAWGFILTALASDTSTVILETLSAGPLEDLISQHPYVVIERVEVEARRNPKFAHLLGGVWKSSRPDDVWERVQAVWDRRGWDGIPSNTDR